jgi:hypothetical protein
MNVAFWDNQLGERGTTTSLYDYAYYNQTILGNRSFIFYDKYSEYNKQVVIDRFCAQFFVHASDGFNAVDKFLKLYGITHIYIIKYGVRDNRLSSVAKNLIHCVFTCTEPHGDVYSSISPWVNGNDGKYPVVPHMIVLPDHDRNMRQELNIPTDAVVFGGYGGHDRFSIPFVKQVVFDVASKNPNIYFLFANFDRFCPELANIIHLSTIYDPEEKTRFINTTDAMLWARHDGEVLSIAMGEFSIKNKPIITMNIGYPGHVHLLGDQAIWYNDPTSLQNILLSFDPKVERLKDWNAYRKFTPEKVMRAFEAIYLR